MTRDLIKLKNVCKPPASHSFIHLFGRPETHGSPLYRFLNIQRPNMPINMNPPITKQLLDRLNLVKDLLQSIHNRVREPAPRFEQPSRPVREGLMYAHSN